MSAAAPSAAEQAPDRPAEADRKALDTLRAQAAMRGFVVHTLPGGAFLIGRWGLTRECADLDELRRVLADMGITAP